MNVYVAEEAGFCFGVKRALKIIEHLSQEGQAVQIYGQLIHNRTVLDQLKARGIDYIESLDQLDPAKKLIVRTHGIPKDEQEFLEKNKIDYLDATCPLVKKLHYIIDKIDTKKNQIIIVGDKKHPEIIAAASYASNPIVINTEEEAANLGRYKSIAVIAQTTLDTQHFKAIVSILVDKAETLQVHNTICSATRVRQQAIRDLAPRVDFVVVVGGKNSSNTRKLYNIARHQNPNTYHIESSNELKKPEFIDKIKHFRSVGITAGASTPPEEIEYARIFFKTIVKEINHGRSKREPQHRFDH